MIARDTKNAWLFGVCAGLARNAGLGPLGLLGLRVLVAIPWHGCLLWIVYLILACLMSDDTTPGAT